MLLKREHEQQRRHERRRQRQRELQQMRRRLGGQHYGKRRRHEKQKQNERQRRHERRRQMLDGQQQQCERLQQKRNGQRSGLYREPLILSDECDDDEFLPLYILLRKYFLSRLFYLNAIYDCEPNRNTPPWRALFHPNRIGGRPPHGVALFDLKDGSKDIRTRQRDVATVFV